jgi:hypothetical protein
LTRQFFIERTLRQIYGGQPTDDASITVNLVNSWLNDAIAIAAKTNYTDNLKLDGISYVNGGFYTTFKGIELTQDEFNVWKLELPHVPVGLGANEGINTAQIKENSTNISRPLTWINQSQKTYYQNMRQIPNKVLAYLEGKFIYVISTILLDQYTASVSMVSGGDSTDLTSELNVPSDYFPQMVEYIKGQLVFERMQIVDNQNDGVDAVKTV